MTGITLTVSRGADRLVPPLSERAREARSRFEPPNIVIPAPRSADGVVIEARPLIEQDAPAADLLAAADDLVAALEQLEGEQDPAHRVVLRIAALAAAGIPEAGWSEPEQIEVDALRGASDAAGALLVRTESLLFRLEADSRLASAAEIEFIVTTLRVVGVVADLEVFQRAGR